MTVAVGIVGVGMMGGKHARTILDEVSGAELVALADVDVDRVRTLSRSLGVDRVYRDAADLIADPGVDAVLIASIAETHDELVLFCLEAGKPVFCEKPLSPNAERSWRVVEAEAGLGHRLVQIGFMRRFDPAYLGIKRLLDEGEIGAPLLVHCAHRNAEVPDFVTSEMALTESVVHEVDVIRWLLGQEIVAVTVHAPRPTRHAPALVRDPQLVLFETDGGVLADVETFLRARYGYQVRCEVVGETGSLSLPAPAVLRVAREGCDSLVLQDGFDRFAQAFRHEIQAWVDSVRDAQPVGPDAWDGYAASAVIEASVRAAATRQRIEVALEPRPPMRSSLFEDA